MAKLFDGRKKFNPGEHKDMGEFDLIPDETWVKGEVTKAHDRKRNGKDTGYVYKLEFTVTEGTYKGRKLFTNLNLEHENDSTVEQAEKELATICRAAGKGPIDDTNELLKIPMNLFVRIEKGKGEQPDQNRIKKYKRIDEIAAAPGKLGGSAGSSGSGSSGAAAPKKSVTPSAPAKPGGPTPPKKAPMKTLGKNK
jgi:hypothetical protein